ncbi:Hint domain-containing protein [Frigidibacter sp. MR17.14]|uniref:Hint domain-containing protein n=1 Tax=Frigidibacter sp. MR17.14 TaxID=3126509 RepID=UPI003012C6AC
MTTTSHVFLGVAPGAFSTVGGAAVQAGSLIYLNPEWTEQVNALTFIFTDVDGIAQGDALLNEIGDDPLQQLVVKDAAGNTLGSGVGYLEDQIVATAPDGSTLKLYRVEIAGVYQGIVIDGAVTPGVQYTITAVNNVDALDNPLYSAFDSLTYDQTLANTITGGSGNETLSGGLGNDSISGGAGNDSILGGDGNDTLLMGAGQNTVSGGDGADYIDDVVGPRLIGPNYIDAGAGADTVYSGDGNDTIYGGDGNDVINAEGGNDWIDGGAGDDNIQAGTGSNTVYGGAGNDRIDDITGVVGDPGPNVYHGGDGNDSMWSGNGNDTLFGDAGNDAIYAEGGNDLIDGGAGADWVQAGAGDDTVFGGSESDVLLGEAGNDAIYGGTGDDYIGGGTGDDTQWGEAGADAFYVISGDGSDTIFGGEQDGGIDRLDFSYMGSSDHLTLLVTGWELGSYTVDGGTATGTFWEIEAVVGGGGSDTIDGSAGMGNMSQSGGAGDDLILGGSGADTLLGGTGNDTLGGGTGDDLLTGGAGNDVFRFLPAGGQDLITDFDMTLSGGRTADQFDVSALRTAGGDPIVARDVTVVDDGFGNALLVFPDGSSVTLAGISAATVQAPGQLQAMGIPCLVDGTLIDTPQGPCPVEDLRPGSLVETLGQGAQPVLWLGRRRVGRAALLADPRLAPVEIRAGTLGNDRALRLSQLHALAIQHPGGARLVRAGHLADHGVPGIRIARGAREVTYCHLLLPRHAIIRAQGVPVETLWPGPVAMAGLGPELRLSLIRAHPRLARAVLGFAPVEPVYGPRALPVLRRRELADLAGPLRPMALRPLMAVSRES